MRYPIVHYRYVLIFLAFVPFAFYVLSGEAEAERVRQIEGVSQYVSPPLLSADSNMHWLFAAIAATIFFAGAVVLLDRGTREIPAMIIATVFTATIGMIFLFAVQKYADQSIGEDWSGDWNRKILHYFLNGIANAYQATDQTDVSYWIQLAGYIFGVGLCEEVTKIIPVLFLLRTERSVSESKARVVGFMSGVGFGITESVMYSARDYNGNASGSIYLIRFLSCIALHGLATGVAAGFLVSTHFERDLEGDFRTKSLWMLLAKLALIISPSIILHALYDISGQRGFFDVALCCELLLGAIFAFQIDRREAAAF